jgi:hypothetical protein
MQAGSKGSKDTAIPCHLVANLVETLIPDGGPKRASYTARFGVPGRHDAKSFTSKEAGRLHSSSENVQENSKDQNACCARDTRASASCEALGSTQDLHVLDGKVS